MIRISQNTFRKIIRVVGCFRSDQKLNKKVPAASGKKLEPEKFLVPVELRNFLKASQLRKIGGERVGLHSTEVAFLILIQQPQVRLSVFPKYLLLTFIDSTA